jgi:hypothetical protein
MEEKEYNVVTLDNGIEYTEIARLNDNNNTYVLLSNLDDSEDKWKTYLYQGIKGELRKRLDEMIANSEYHDFFKALSYEYGFGVEKNLDKALAIYIKSAGPNSKDYLSITRLYDIYRYDRNISNVVLSTFYLY